MMIPLVRSDDGQHHYLWQRKQVVLCLTAAFLGTAGIFVLLPTNTFTLNCNALTKCSEQPLNNKMRPAFYEDLLLDADHNKKTQVVSISETATSLFEFAIIGYPKTGTSFLGRYFRNHVPEVYMPRTEICGIDDTTTQHDLISRFYHPDELCGKDITCGIASAKNPYERMHELYKKKHDDIAVRSHVKGFKCPRLLEGELSFPNAMRFMKQSNFIIQVRHPILWFESYYNYRSRERYPEALLSPNDLVGSRKQNDPYVEQGGVEHIWNVCTNRARFHHSLARLGLTPMDTHQERKMLDDNMSVHPINGKVFLLEVGQLSTANQTRSDQFRHDIQDFLGLEGQLHPLPRHNKKPAKPTKARLIDICDNEHKKAHDALLQNGIEAAEWIKTYFLKSDRVHVTSREYFLELLDQWSVDPCVGRREKKKAAGQYM